jgi:tetratricopeptide (TPR) repeat protein
MPSGRGLLANGAFFLPTTTKQLLKIDVSNGQIIRTQSTSDVLGNLVAYRDQIVSQGVDWLAVYHQAEPLRHKIRERLEDNPDDIWALARQAELFLFDDKRKEALKVLEHAHELAPEDESIRSLLVTSLLSALHEDFASYRQFADDLERLIDQPARRAEYYRLMAVGLQDAGEPTPALEYFIKLATFETSPLRRGIDASEVLVEVEPQLRVRRDRWIKSQLSKMIRSASGPALEEIQRTIEDHLQTVIASGSVNRLRRFVNQFGGDVAVARARLELARRLIQHQSWLEAELHLVDLNSEQQPEIAATATAMLAELLLDSGRLSESAYYYSQLNEKWGDIPVNGPVTGQELARRALQQDQLVEIVNQQAKWPSGKSRFERIETPPRQFQRYLRVYPVQLDNAVGPYLRQHHVAYNQSMNSLLIRDELGTPTSEILLGDTSRFYSSDYSTSSISAKGHLLFVAIGYEVLAIDMLRSGSEQSDSILWRKDLSSSLGNVATTQRRLMTQPIKRDWGPNRYVPVERTRKPIGLVGPITRSGVFYQKGQELTCSDPLTGEAIWIRGGLEPGSDIFGDEQLLFVVGPASDEAIVLNTANGEELGRRAIPPRQTRWLTSGRCVLNCAPRDGQLEIQLLDVWEQAAVWQRTADQRSQCCRVDSEEIAVLEPSGEFAILRIADGSPRVEATLQAEPDLARLFVLPSNDDYLVAASDIRDNSINSSVSGNRVFGPLGLDHCRLINGHMYCFDRHSGEALWPQPATIRQFSLPLDQPTGTPLVVLLRHISKRKSGQSRGSTTTASLLCLDRRTGSQVLREDEMPALRSYAVTGDPQENSVDIMTNSVGFRVTFTDESAQDTSPLQMQEPVSALETFEKVRNRIANSILDAITKKPAEQDASGETDNKQPEKKE